MLTNIASTGFVEAIEGWIPPVGLGGGLAVIVVTLIKGRSSDRSQLSEDQQAHMDRLTRERNEAVEQRDKAQLALDAERELRRQAQEQVSRVTINMEALEARVRELTDRVAELQEEIRELREAEGSGGGHHAAHP